jgi:hypothetical protein
MATNATQLVRLMQEIAGLPLVQRRILVPIFATALQKYAPTGRDPPAVLAEAMQTFWQSVTGASEEETERALQNLLDETGVTRDLLRQLSIKASLPDISVDLLRLSGSSNAPLGARAKPKAGQIRAGACARFEAQKKFA